MASEQPPMDVPLGRGASVKVLVVEDNEDCLTTLVDLLLLYGYDVLTARDGVEALEVAHRDLPNVMLLDIGLPRLDGFEVARRVRASPALAGMFIAAVTGFGTPVERERALRAGVHEYLVKPVAADRMRAVLQAAEDHPAGPAPGCA